MSVDSCETICSTFIGEHAANIGVDTTRDAVGDTDGFGDIKVGRCVVVAVVVVFIEERHSVK
jgi:hypothetical protein